MRPEYTNDSNDKAEWLSAGCTVGDYYNGTDGLRPVYGPSGFLIGQTGSPEAHRQQDIERGPLPDICSFIVKAAMPSTEVRESLWMPCAVGSEGGHYNDQQQVKGKVSRVQITDADERSPHNGEVVCEADVIGYNYDPTDEKEWMSEHFKQWCPRPQIKPHERGALTLELEPVPSTVPKREPMQAVGPLNALIGIYSRLSVVFTAPNGAPATFKVKLFSFERYPDGAEYRSWKRTGKW